MTKPKVDEKPKSEAKPKCFIIMPITRPSAMAACYPDGDDHFTYILNSLFIPSVEAAGFKPDPPAASGSEIIQARIIKKLIDADMVLCDMSCLNANVFFEFGIRTALNKPVCVVKDSQSPGVAFDTSIIHYHKYQSPLYAHQTADEIKSLTTHIHDTWTKNKKTNAMWQALGFQLTAQVAQPTGKPDDQMLQMLAGITNRLDGLRSTDKFSEPPLAKGINPDSRMRMIEVRLRSFIPASINYSVIWRAPNIIRFMFTGFPHGNVIEQIKSAANESHVLLEWRMPSS